MKRIHQIQSVQSSLLLFFVCLFFLEISIKYLKKKKSTELRCIIQNDPVNQNSNIYEDEKIESNSKAYDTYGLKAFDIHMSERIKKE